MAKANAAELAPELDPALVNPSAKLGSLGWRWPLGCGISYDNQCRRIGRVNREWLS